jgi:hypothetical protein
MSKSCHRPVIVASKQLPARPHRADLPEAPTAVAHAAAQQSDPSHEPPFSVGQELMELAATAPSLRGRSGTKFCKIDLRLSQTNLKGAGTRL